MAGIKELQAKLKEDAALAEQFKAAKSIDDVIEIAQKVGYTVSCEDIEKMTDVSLKEMREIAGGYQLVWLPSADSLVIARD